MKLNVIKQRRLWWTISVVVILACAIAMAISFARFNAPLRPSLDFVGGTRLQLELDCSVPGNCDQPIDIAEVREVMNAQGLGNSSIQVVGQQKHTLSVRTKALDVEQRTQLQSALSKAIGRFDPQSIQIDTIGPTISQELLTSGLLALIVSFFGIIVYLSVRFQFDYALFAIVALFHDAFITAGVFAVLGLVAGVKVGSLFLVALLTTIGFSVNDTVVIYDRIRETSQQRSEDSIDDIVDDAVNQTLTRSINTTLTTLLPLLAIFLFGGETLQDFALALIIGFILGAYSSLFIASTLLAWWRERSASVAIANAKPSDQS
ncbi:MAG: protein translocase subunit SecF [Cyanobacteria bacterium QH_8_48_120]|jgi:preprotein translocase subunit SecF|nr:MAG: protein translocase subunit SecF [Cyanobacteria bacterium QH_1_48_107]PSO58404.1 MAG: protein translocase subunit SecF [Cyanobacteria bacterium QH_10_48_56]PSO59825.1 MAG: protein translocase subunit SecF [Cyanobacteria bacterium QH_2_48_84]PSO62926.1 MAG: protein translocase subunit SecF [Cyanobacteria bacterium QH_6_48_35]PSO67701.1 MAG: protein translocase subunit SecF [Cyanobacteria bacterium QH_7_48_89]PSO72809.1 MAG: protein translocase subunit SecF [Cyanobacteria bacterium QS_1_